MASKVIPGTQTTFVLSFFEDFYARVAHHKNHILNRRWITDEDEAAPNGDGGEAEKYARKILNELKELLDRQALEAPRFGGEFAAQYYREAQYIMVALADEIFLNLDWRGSDYWDDNLLESAFFETHEAGSLLFKRLDEFLVTRDPVRKDIGHLYLLALGLGFLGKYRETPDQGRINSYTRQLYVFVYHQDPNLYEEEGDKLIAEAYAHTMKHGNPKNLHDFRPWIILFAGAFLTLTMISLFIWHAATKDINTSVDKILSVKERLERRES